MSESIFLENIQECQLLSTLVSSPEFAADAIFAEVDERFFRLQKNRNLFCRLKELHDDREKSIALAMIDDPELTLHAAEMVAAFPPAIGNLPVILKAVKAKFWQQLTGKKIAQLAEMHQAGHPLIEILSAFDELRDQMTRSQYYESIKHIDQINDRFGDKESFELSKVPDFVGQMSTLSSFSPYKNGDLIIFGGRPSMGKTDFALQFVRGEKKRGQPVGIYSLEMYGHDLFFRMAQGAGSEHNSNMPMSEVERFLVGKEFLRGLPIYIDDNPYQNIHTLRASLKYMVNEFGIKLAVVDYLTLMETPKASSRTEEITKLSRAMKLVAKELDIPLMILSNLNRNCESRFDKRPMSQDLRDSGALEQDADIIQFIWRPSVYGWTRGKRGEDLKCYAELIYTKNRRGKTGTVPIYYDPATKLISGWAGDIPEIDFDQKESKRADATSISEIAKAYAGQIEADRIDPDNNDTPF